MVKKIVILAVLFLMVFQNSAVAVETAGEVIFKDAVYGAIIGALVGGAIYLIDDRDPGTKIGLGVAVGTLGGVIYGITETQSMVEIKQDEVKFALPTPVIQKKDDSIIYSTTFFKVDF